MIIVKTNELKKALSKAVKCASSNRFCPLTNMLALELREENLILKTTDMNNYLYVSCPIESKKTSNFYAVIEIERFSKLISMLTSEFVDLNVTESVLEVVANGTYKFELQVDENGVVEFPTLESRLSNLNVKGTYVIDAETIFKILGTSRASLANNLTIPVYANYYLGDCVLTTDTYKICELRTHIFDNPMLLSGATLDLIGSFCESDVEITVYENKLKIATDFITLVCSIGESVENFKVELIKDVINRPCEDSCLLNKHELLDALNRICLFIDTYDDNLIKLQFGADILKISSLKTTGEEVIELHNCTVTDVETMYIDSALLLEQIKVYPKEEISLAFRKGNFIKLTSDDIIQIVALSQKN